MSVFHLPFGFPGSIGHSVLFLVFYEILCHQGSVLCVRYIADLETREKKDPETTHIINIDIQDNPEEATIGAFMICDLCCMVCITCVTLPTALIFHCQQLLTTVQRNGLI
jgi:hypothetical protein